MDRTGQKYDKTLELLAARLGGDLARGTVSTTVLDSALTDLQAPPGARVRAVAALEAAGIVVVHDSMPRAVAEASAASLTDRSAPELSTRDPLDAARARLLKDQQIAPWRRQKLLLSAEEEVGLTLLARPDGEPLEPGGFASLRGEARLAAEAIVVHNLGLAHSVSQRMTGLGLEYDDLVASAVPGLVRAVELFDPSRGLKFSTYAMHWVRQSITRALANEGRAVRLPVHMYDTVRAVMGAQERLTVDGRRPRVETVAEECRLPVEKVVEALRLAPGVVSLETPLGNDGFTLGDLLDAQTDRPEHIEVGGLFPEDLVPLLDQIDQRESDVLQRRYGLPPYDEPSTLEEIGRVYGVTRERVRQIESKAMKNIRTSLRRRGVEVPDPPKRKGGARSADAPEEAEVMPVSA